MAESQRNRPSNQWVHTVRAGMASDDSRTWFDAKVQEHGFDFLDDYLDRILAQAKQPQPIIELVKTPNRRRNPQTKGKFAVPSSSRLRSVLTASIEEPETEDDQTLPPNAFAEALIDAGNEEDTFSRPIPPSAQLVVPTVTNARLSPVVEVSYHAEQVIEPTSELKSSIGPPNASLPDVRPPSPELEPRQEEIVVGESINGAPPSPPMSPMDVSPELPSEKTLPTPPDDEVPIVSEQHPPSSKPAVMSDISKSPAPQPEPSTRPGPLRPLHTTENADMKSRTAPLPALATNVFTPLPPPTDIPGTRLMRKASAPQLQPNLPAFVRDPAPQPTPAIPKRTSWLVKARDVHQEAKTLTHTKRAESHHGIPESSAATTNHLAKSTKRKPSEIFDGVEIPPRHSGKVQKVTETDVQTNATRELHEQEKREKEEEKERDEGKGKGKERQMEVDIQQEPQSDFDILDEEDPLHTLKRTVKGLGSRAGKSMGKSIGGLAAAALAEARATAEARIAEKTEKFNVIDPKLNQPEPQPQQAETEVPQAKSDLQQQPPQKDKSPAPQPTNVRASLHKERVFQPPSQADVIKLKAQKDDVSKSNDPTQPTRSILKPPPVHQPVFSKPVFTAPKPKPRSPKPPTVTNIGLQPSFSSTSNNKLDDAPAPTAWLLENQENRDRDKHDDHTAFSTALYDTRNDLGGPGSDLDEGDSWHDGDKLNPIWSSLNFDGPQRDDEMTWSTIPTQNHTSSTQGFHTTNTESSTNTGYKSTKSREEKEKESLEILGSAKSDVPSSPPKQDRVLEKAREALRELPHETDDISMEIDEVEEPAKVASEQSMIAPSNSQGGLLSNALKTVAGVFGAGKKAKTPDPPKSLQLSASLSKKQKEEEDKKVSRMKEMELRRQQIAEKKAEVEKSKKAEEEQKARLEAEKKREREEDASKKVLAKPPTTTKKATEDPSKQRKVEGDGSASGSQSSQSSKPPSQQQQPQPKSILKTPAPAKETTPAVPPPKLIPTPAPSSDITTKPKVAATPLKKGAPNTKGKAKATHDDELLPSQIVKKDMAARARAKLDPPAITSESIQLPEIDSEYSDSDDEDRKKNFDPPDWAQQANVTDALQSLSKVNPDNIFGAVQPLAIEDMFRTRTSRFRARTSSANWNGPDGLTKEEEEDYVRRMGFDE
ncbi:hypothetical protein BJ322DRAFT_1107046 [Thelephora terrestris]|uniref:Inner centromere protein ARK-binding domain-containing protein n=1 Tax=Thelephora terrestris TaxID=56493 RepID=A0A9P6L7R1_9AGAM|nr:hypothetical protein BJ322DRAFT_1107046 [Thelephora terrestris]